MPPPEFSNGSWTCCWTNGSSKGSTILPSDYLDLLPELPGIFGKEFPCKVISMASRVTPTTMSESLLEGSSGLQHGLEYDSRSWPATSSPP